jgi:hypothetical protein
MSGAARDFGRYIFQQVEQGRGVEVEQALTPRERDSAERTRWIREAVAGQRLSEWEEVEDDMPAAHRQANAAIRSATQASRQTVGGEGIR